MIALIDHNMRLLTLQSAAVGLAILMKIQYSHKNTTLITSDIIKKKNNFNINFNGARYSLNGGRFYTTDVHTTDKDVAKLFEFTINKCKEIYNIVPKKEMIILDYDGETDINTFITRNLRIIK